MDIQLKGTNYEITPDIQARAEKKFSALKKYLGNHEETAFVYVDIGKETGAQTGRIWKVDANLKRAGEQYYAKALEETVENAIDHAVSELSREVRRSRNKRFDISKRGGAFLKSLMRRGR